MAERAFHFEGTDEITKEHVRIQLRLVTETPTESGLAPLAGLFAPRGFLPDDVRPEIERRRQAGVSGCSAQTFGSTHSIAPAEPFVFAAPRGFLQEA